MSSLQNSNESAKITASFTFHGREFKDVEVINPGDYFGTVWLLEIGNGFSSTPYIVEAFAANEAIDELIDSGKGDALKIDPSQFADYGVESDEPTCYFGGNDCVPCDLEHLAIHGDDRTGFSGVLYHVEGWPVPVKPTDLGDVRDKLDQRDQYAADVARPGKFEGEQSYVPYFWDAYLGGDADDDYDGVLTFNVTDDDRTMFPALEGVDHVYLAEDNNGFVSEVDAPEDVDDMSGRGEPTDDDTSNDVDANELDEFTTAYVETALWSSTDESNEQGGEPMDANYGPDDIAPETLRQMVADCRAFQSEHAADIESDLSRAGHDFWLTRNRHGAGFWDGDWDEEVGKRLTDAAHVYGSFDLYVGDDGKIYG